MTKKEILEQRNANSEKLQALYDELKSEETEKRDIEDIEKDVNDCIQKNAELDGELKKIEERKKTIDEVKKGQGAVMPTPIIEKREKTNEKIEVRNSQEYINAYANYIKTGDDTECRSLLTEKATGGTIPVPEIVDSYINTAWDKLVLLNKVHRTNLKGIVKVGFELSATDAAIHEEGKAAPVEEELKLGIVTLTPQTIKKWITVSDEALDLNGAAFLEYIYSEITYKILKFAEGLVVDKILNSPEVATATAAGVPQVKLGKAYAVADIFSLKAKLSDEATNLTLIMSKATEAAYKTVAAGANYMIDIFDGIDVVTNEKAGDKVILADLNGVHANFTNGNDVTFKFDDLSLAEKDLVKIVGRLPIAIEVTKNATAVVGVKGTA